MPFILLSVAVVLIIILAVILKISDMTFKITFYQSDKQKIKNNNPYLELSSEQYRDIMPDIKRLVTEADTVPFEKIEISSSFDGTSLVGRFYKFSDSNELTIFFHGYRGTALRDGCGGFKMSRESKRNILMVDQRGNGLSGGNIIAFGVLERHDCLDWVNYAVNRFGCDLKIALSGVSLGAATVLMAADVGLPKNVKCIIADCGYSSPKEIICKVAKESGYPVGICYPILRLTGKIRAHFDVESESAVKSVANTDIPILIIHGDDDRYVPCEMAYKIYDACSSEKELLIVKGAPHVGAFMVDEKKYSETVSAFMAKHGFGQ